MENSDFEVLLSKYNILQNGNEQKKKSGVHDYSLMNALLKKTDEVNLHSNFIYSMINPNSSHYYGNKFLKLFLESINEDDFIDIENAKVYKEKGKIDLLVEDGNHVLIIENKLRAVDQEHQISRYIQYVIENYLDNDKVNLETKIHIVYLSEYKATPSDKSQSIIGFELVGKELKWQNNPQCIDVTRKGKFIGKLDLDLPDDICFKFNRVKHSKELYEWVIEAKEYLVSKPNSQSLIYAFDEYKLILDRLKDNKWRNIMKLDEFTLNIEDEKEQEKMYDFMIEAKQLADEYSGKKLYRDISKQIEKLELELYDKNKEFKESNCIKWFKEKGEKKSWRDIGFFFTSSDTKYIFLLGVKNIYFGVYDDSTKGINKDNRYNKESIFEVIEKFKNL